MLEYIGIFYNYFKLFISLSLFTFIFKFCFDTCNEKVTIKNKHGKKKQTIKSRIGLAITYLFFCVMLYFSLSPKVFFTILSLIGIGTLYALDKFDKPTVNQLCIYDKNKLLRMVWKILYTVINIVFFLYSPVHRVMSSNFTNLFTNAKNKTTSTVNKHLFSGMGEGLGGLGDITTMVSAKGKDLGQNLKKVIHDLTSDNDDNNDNTLSSMGDYINKTDNDKSKQIIGQNQKIIIEEETSTENIVNEIPKEEVKLTQNEIEDFNKFKKILNSDVLEEENEESVNEESNDQHCKIENDDIDKKEESEKLLKLFKQMNDIFSTTEEASTIIDNVNNPENTD